MFNVGRGEIYINVSFWNSVERICNLTKVNGEGVICTCVEIILFLCILKRKKGHCRVRSLEFMYGSCLDFTHKLKVYVVRSMRLFVLGFCLTKKKLLLVSGRTNRAL